MLAQPWWVNLLIFVPLLTYLLWRRRGLFLSWRKLLVLALFGASFGFVEAVVVVYLRAAAVTAVGHSESTSPPLQSSVASYQQAESFLAQIPASLRTIEVFREAATMIMLSSVAAIAGFRTRERWGAFLWTFATWDLTYYAGLWVTLGWPSSLRDYDILFLIPVPWFAQVWFPVMVSSLTIIAIALSPRSSLVTESVADNR